LGTAQRILFDVNSEKNGKLLKADVNDVLLACDPDFNFDCLPSLPSVLGLTVGKNPLDREFYAPAIRNGATNSFVAGSGFFTTIVDNLHFNATPIAQPDSPIDEPGVTAFGCPVCAHVHWRWSSAINSSLASTVIQFDPTFAFDNNGGKPKIPMGSNQDVDVAVLKTGDASEEHPTNVWNMYQANTSILPSVLMADTTKPQLRPVFWYIATGHQNSDQFFIHGGGFGTFYVNRIGLQNPSSVSLNIEHTRDVEYKVEVFKNVAYTTSNPPVITPTPIAATSASSGMLLSGTDDLTLTFSEVLFDSTNAIGGVDVTVTLTDNGLKDSAGNPRKYNKWVRTFHFNSASTQEP
jgi:hypothetical protein